MQNFKCLRFKSILFTSSSLFLVSFRKHSNKRLEKKDIFSFSFRLIPLKIFLYFILEISIEMIFYQIDLVRINTNEFSKEKLNWERQQTITMLFGSKPLKICAFICFISMVSAFPSSDENNDCSNYCQNDGICVVIKNQRQCYCLPGWTGELCKDPREYKLIQFHPSQRNQMSSARNQECAAIPPNFCNGGVCRFNGTKKEFSCVCPYDKIGQRCEIPSRTFRTIQISFIHFI